MVVAAMDGVVKLLIVAALVVCSNVPPEAAVYHRKIPFDTELALKLAVPVPQMLAPVTVAALLANK